MRQLTEEEQKEIDNVFHEWLNRGSAGTINALRFGYVAALDHVQPKFDAIQVMLTDWKQQANEPLASEYGRVVIRDCIEDLETILAGERDTANAATLNSLGEEDK